MRKAKPFYPSVLDGGVVHRYSNMVEHQTKPSTTYRASIHNLSCFVLWEVALAMLFLLSHLPLEKAFASMSESSPLVQNHQVDEDRNLCIEDAKSLDKSSVLASDQGIPLTEPGLIGPPISLGCQLRYCGPSQDTQDKQRIELQLQLTGDPIAESVVLELSKLPISKSKTDIPLIEVIRGAATVNARTGSMSIRIPREKRVSILLSQDLVRDGTFVAARTKIKASLVLSKPLLEKLRKADATSQAENLSWIANLDIDQFKGSVQVNEFRVRYQIHQCKSMTPHQKPDQSSTDQIALVKMDGTQRRVGFVNAQVSGGRECLRYKSIIGTNSLPIGNKVGNLVSPNTECQPNEIVVFSPDRAAYFGPPDPDWSANTNDLVKIDLPQRPAILPVSIKILSTKGENTRFEEIKSQIETELNYASQLFGPMNNCGVRFEIESIQDKRREAEGLEQMSCNKHHTVKELEKIDPLVNPNAINVFYISNTPINERANHCAIGIFIGADRTIETLAHELGHSLGLEDAQTENHSAGSELLARNNLMTSGGKGRTDLSNGQCYRLYTNEASKLRTLSPQTRDPKLQLPGAKDCKNRTGHDNNCMDIGAIVKTHTGE